MPVIDLCVQIWPNHPRRLEYFERTMAALSQKLSAGGCTLSLRVSAESEEPSGPGCRWCGEELADLCRDLKAPLRFRDGPANMARHLDEIFGGSEGDLLFFCQDDYELNRPLDIGPAARLLLDERESRLAGIRFWANSDYEDERQQGWLRVRRNTNFAYADNPALWHPRFFRELGPFPDGGKHLAHEILMSGKLAESDLVVLAAAEVEDEPNYWFGHTGFISSVPVDRRWPQQIQNRISDLRNFV
jgi:hypothetical protein